MKLGNDFWMIFRIIKAVLKALVEVFGDDEDIQQGNHDGLFPKGHRKTL